MTVNRFKVGKLYKVTNGTLVGYPVSADEFATPLADGHDRDPHFFKVGEVVLLVKLYDDYYKDQLVAPRDRYQMVVLHEDKLISLRWTDDLRLDYFTQIPPEE